MNKEQPITAELCQSAQDHTPFEGFMTKGWPTHTIVRGQVMFADGKVIGDKSGQFIKRPTALHEN